MCADDPPTALCLYVLFAPVSFAFETFVFSPQILMSFWGSEILKVRLCISFGVFVFVLMVSGTLVTLFIYQCLVCEEHGKTLVPRLLFKRSKVGHSI